MRHKIGLKTEKVPVLFENRKMFKLCLYSTVVAHTRHRVFNLDSSKILQITSRRMSLDVFLDGMEKELFITLHTRYRMEQLWLLPQHSGCLS